VQQQKAFNGRADFSAHSTKKVSTCSLSQKTMTTPEVDADVSQDESDGLKREYKWVKKVPEVRTTKGVSWETDGAAADPESSDTVRVQTIRSFRRSWRKQAQANNIR
jgi:hypothetical protein